MTKQERKMLERQMREFGWIQLRSNYGRKMDRWVPKDTKNVTPLKLQDAVYAVTSRA